MNNRTKLHLSLKIFPKVIFYREPILDIETSGITYRWRKMFFERRNEKFGEYSMEGNAPLGCSFTIDDIEVFANEGRLWVYG